VMLISLQSRKYSIKQSFGTVVVVVIIVVVIVFVVVIIVIIIVIVVDIVIVVVIYTTIVEPTQKSTRVANQQILRKVVRYFFGLPLVVIERCDLG
jgi:hypothetical protein